MAIVKNVGPHPLALTSGGLLAPLGTANVNVADSAEAAYIAAGQMILIDGTVDPPPPPTIYDEVEVGRGTTTLYGHRADTGARTPIALGGAARTVIDVSSPEYGATGDVSQTDAMTRINAAIADAHAIGVDGRNTLAGGTIVRIPQGVYIANESMKYREGVWVQGFGPKATVILRKPNTTTKLLEPATLAENTWAVSDMRFDGNRANQAVAADAIALDRGDYPTYDVPGFLAGPAVAGYVSSLFGGGDFIGLHNLIVSNVLGKGMTTTGQCSQFHFRGIFVWFTSDHGIDSGDVDNEWHRIQIGNTGRAGFKAGGANNRFSHVKLYETDVLGEGWGALELTGSKHNVDGFEVQEAGTQGVRIYGSMNHVNGRVDGCRGVGVQLNGGNKNEVRMHVNSFPAYAPTYLVGIGNACVGNFVDIVGGDYSVAAMQGYVNGNELRLNGGLV